MSHPPNRTNHCHPEPAMAGSGSAFQKAKNRRTFTFGIIMAVALACAGGCGEKLPLPVAIKDDGGRLQDTVYVAVQPPWTEAGGTQFKKPRGISVGYDRSIYICDTDNNRIVRLDPDGGLVDSFPIVHPVAVAQNRGLDLLCVNESPRVWVRRWLGHSGFVLFIALDSARICTSDNDTSICHNVPARATAVAASPSPDLRFFVVEEAAGAVDWVGLDLPAALSAVNHGQNIGQVYAPDGVAAWPSGDSYRLIVTQYPSFPGVQYFEAYTRRPVVHGDAADIFNRTSKDEKSVAVDDLGNVYVLHRTTGTVMTFDRRGALRLSFGRPGNDPLGLNNPSGIAVLDETLYIADTGNNRIVRFQKTSVPEN